MGSPLGSILANAFICFYERKWLEECPSEFKPAFYRDMLMIFLFFPNQPIISKNFVTILMLVTQTCPFLLRKKKMIKCPFYMLKFHKKTVNL